MKQSEFIDCNLVGISWREMDDIASKFAGPISTIQNCLLKYNTFLDMSLRGFNFSNAEITDSTFAECDLMRSHFENCKLERTEFVDCDLRKADFRKASGYLIDAMTNRIADARFSYPDVVNLLYRFQIKID